MASLTETIMKTALFNGMDEAAISASSIQL